MQPHRVVSPNWLTPIAVPGFGVYFPNMGLQDVPEPAIEWLESNGFVTTVEQSTSTEESKTAEESTTQRKKRNVKPDAEPAESKE